MRNSDDAPNIFTINTSAKLDSGDQPRLEIPSARELSRELKGLLTRLMPVPDIAQQVAQQATQRLRSALDPAAEQRREALQHRQQLQTLLNDIDRQLLEVNRRLAYSASSMCTFGESHDLDGSPRNTVAFLRDAAIFLKEMEPPDRLEAKLSALESTADSFRSLPDLEISCQLDESIDESIGSLEEEMSVEEELARQKRADLQTACSDLRVDVAVLLESALMAAQQALAIQKRLSCRLQLLVCEYEPIYRQEISGRDADARATSSVAEPPAFLPLDLGDASETGDTARPAPEVRGAQAYSELANGGALKELGGLVLELERRTRRLRDCSEELRELLLREVAT